VFFYSKGEMVLSEEDKEWFQNAFTNSLTKVENLLQTLSTSITHLGKRVLRVEQAFMDLSKVAKTKVVEAARKEHERLVREMFDGSEILAVPTLVTGEGGKLTRGSISAGCTREKVQEFVDGYDSEYDIELAPNLGFRLVHQSRSAQKRRKSAAEVIKHARDAAKKQLNLHLQYDKPFELRSIQGKAQKFLSKLKREGKDLVVSAQAKGGYLLVNDVRLAPEYLVPEPHRWSGLIGLILSKLRGGSGRAPVAPEQGLLYDVFGNEFACDAGIFHLSDIPLDDTPMYE
jgi:hypothetical protein